MSYRRNGPSWNILLLAAIEDFSRLACLVSLARVAAVALLLSGAACSREGAPAAAGAKAPARQGAADPKGGSSPKLRFEPEKADHSDLAVFETVVERIALKSETPVDWTKITVDSSCECLGARFVDTSDPKRAVVELTFNSDKLEDIDGIVRARVVKPREEIEKTGLGELLAEYTAKVVTRRIPFVMPRSIVLEKGGSGRFEIIIGQAFARDAKRPDLLYEDVRFDDAKVGLVDCPALDVESETQMLLRFRFIFELNESARASPFQTKVTIKFGVPSVEKSVVVEWK